MSILQLLHVTFMKRHLNPQVCKFLESSDAEKVQFEQQEISEALSLRRLV